MRSSIKHPLVWIPAFALLVSLTLGCDELPSLSRQSVPDAEADVVTESGRGGYDWRLTGLEFEMQRPTALTFVDKLNAELIRSNLQQAASASSQGALLPDGLDDDVEIWLKRFIVASPAARPISEFEIPSDIDAVSLCMNWDGSRLLTAGKKLIEWDADSGQRLREFDAAIGNCQRVAYDHTLQFATLQNAEKIVKVSLADGMTVATWQAPEGKIESFVSSPEADVQGVVTSENKLFSLADSFQRVTTYRHRRLTSKKIAIHPAGKWIIGLTDGAMMRWRLDVDEASAQFMPANVIDGDSLILVAGTRFDRWIDHNELHECYGPKERLIENRFPYILLNPLVLAAASATDNESQDWLVILGEHTDMAGKRSRFIQDIDAGALEYSLPCPIPVEGFQHLLLNRTCERMAIRKGDQLSVWQRASWIGAESLTIQRLRSLFKEGRTDQIELCAKAIRAKRNYAEGRSGEQLFGEVVKSLGEEWARMDQTPVSLEILTAIDAWYAQRSELALLASSERHLTLGFRGNPAGTYNRQDFLVIQRTRDAQKDLAMLQAGKLPARALFNHVAAAKFADPDIGPTEKWLQQSAEQYPNDVEPWALMCTWLLPQVGGGINEGGALMAAAVQRFPQPDNELFYARTALALARTTTPLVLSGEAGFNTTRIFSAADLLCQRGIATRSEIESLIELAHTTNKPELVNKLVEYHVQHFAMPSKLAYQRPLLNVISTSRAAMLERAKAAKK